MYKAFLMTFEPSLSTSLTVEFVTKQTILDYFDTRPEVKNWITTTTASIVIVSDRDVHYLSNLVRLRFPSLVFIFAEVSTELVDGWTQPTLWDLIRNPTSSGKWPA